MRDCVCCYKQFIPDCRDCLSTLDTCLSQKHFWHPLAPERQCAEVRCGQEGGTSATRAFSVRLWQATTGTSALKHWGIAQRWLNITELKTCFSGNGNPRTAAHHISTQPRLWHFEDGLTVYDHVWCSNAWQMSWSSLLPSPFTTTWH